MSFDQAFTRTVGLEGGYSNNPADPGGETMWGITATTARAHAYVGPMRDMPRAAARAIYQTAFWELVHLDQVDVFSPKIAEELFDTGVNCGVGVPVPFLQRCLNAFNRQGRDYPDVPVDGLAGARTIDALRAFLKVRGPKGEVAMLKALNSLQGARYIELVEKRPTSEAFVYGWFLNRVGGAY
jgi:lysozyme family protein